MKAHRHLIAVALPLALAACYSLPVDYTKSEAPNNIVIDNASSRIDVRFAPDSSQLVGRDAARLRWLAASGHLAPSDRVTVATSGPPHLAAARFASVAAVLLPYRIVPAQRWLGGVPRNHALLDTGRYLVTTPPCPNWSKQETPNFGNALSSNFGCANAINFAQSVAYPADLAEGRPVGPAEAEPAASAVDRYLADKVQLPAATIAPVATTSTGTPAAAGPSAGGQP